ncbi:AMP-dependent synthetase/ligase [Sphingomonas nostoxanthinifaciens]|uniref:AMP-dependent synthetase/ligase n=1 Tax=Sphingomonas nostoxanthinifaciens TaxID=2872652 RepID=UPI001CC207BE|nr:AMP-dependent synthetase/ligase [Sphingomonas nostoxanthinifaciens]UAK24579.1 AMP-dependent synthetase/ligase [Sphingomonas nostoxanthinifaciens]
MLDLDTMPNLVALFFRQAADQGDAPFLWAKDADRWQPLSWRESAIRVAKLAEALRALGLERGDRVMLVAENRPEWAIADLAIMAAGGITVPAYTSNTVADHVHVAENSGARAAIVSTAKLAKPLLQALARSSTCDIAITIEPGPRERIGALRLYEWQALLDAQPGDVAACAAGAGFARSDTACIIYTSGTGGSPRGVPQHHGAILRNVAGCRQIILDDFAHGDEVFLSLLPLSHAYEHSGGLHLPIALGAQIYYAESIDRLAANIEEVRPTIMIVVPRLFELLRARILKQIEKQGGLAQRLLERALALGRKERRGIADRPLDLLLDLTIRRKIRARFGGRLKALVSGGAPLNPEVGGFFDALGLTLLQGYGQTEAGPVISCNRPRAGIRLDTVGPPLDGVTVRIAPDGEILVQGENVMHGYWRNDAETARVLVDGWLHTGDVGHVDDAGRIVITDRKKDLIVNDKGDNVSPQRVEGMLTIEPEIAQAMVAGDRRPYLVGLVVPDAEWRATLPPGADPARLLMAAVDRVNAGLSTTERVRRILVADEPFAIENGELTPSLKVRRHVLRARYGARLDALYAR